MSNLIDIKDVYKIYNTGENEVRALNGVSISIKEGEFTAIVGTSGSGKSTLMNIIGCLDIPSYGQYFLNGEDVSSFNDGKLSFIRNKNIGFIFQGFNLIPSLNAIENIELPLIYRGMNKSMRYKICMGALKEVGLQDRIYHRPSQMSGGQQQRVAIARALVSKPRIILADEPTGNLDSKSGRDVINMLKLLNTEGKSVILITHDNDIARVAKRVIKIIDGKIHEDYFN